MSDRSFLPYARQHLDETDYEAVLGVLKSDLLTQGPAVDALERNLADYLGVGDVVAVANGTAGLHLACLAAGIAQGDAVIVPAFTFAASANCVLYCGATPVFADIEGRTLGLSPASVERAISLARSEGLNPRALIAVHYAGLPCNLPELAALAKSHGLTFVSDACHALGAEHRTTADEPFRKLGSDEPADMSVFSFHAIKHVTTGEGGAVSTGDAGLAKRLRRLRSHGITRDAGDLTRSELAIDPSSGEVNPWYQEMQELGFNYRLSDMAAALGSSQLKRIEAIVARRRAIANEYRAGLSSLPFVTMPPEDNDLATHSYHLFPLRIDFRALGKSRRQVMRELVALGIGTQVHYLPVPFHAYYQDNRDLWLGDEVATTMETYERELSIPMYPRLSDDDVQRVIDALHRVTAGK